jgi:hypothetical protein
MFRRCSFYLLSALFALGTLRGLLLIARRQLPLYVVALLLVPVYASARSYRIARQAGAGPGRRR